MASKEYIERLQMVIHQLHGADSKHIESIPVVETFRGQTAWDGVVEVFELRNHLKAKRCYAWSYRDEKDEHFTAVLEVPPITSAQTAVKAAIISAAKDRKK